jgi:hypothetical protein
MLFCGGMTDTLLQVRPTPHLMPEYPYNADIGQTDLMGAAYNGVAETVARILTMPCDIDAQDNHVLSEPGHRAVFESVNPRGPCRGSWLVMPQVKSFVYEP